MIQLGKVSDEAIAALLKALGDTNADVRIQAAGSLGQSDKVSDGVFASLLEALKKNESPGFRCEAAKLIGEISTGEEMSIQRLWCGLLDRHDNVRMGYAESLAKLEQRIPPLTESIAMKLKISIEDPEFDKTDSVAHRSGHDYAFSGLWLLLSNVVSSHQR